MKTRIFTLPGLLAPPEYSRKPRCRLRRLALALFLTLLAVLLVEGLFLPEEWEAGQEELQAARLMQKATACLRDYRAELGIPLDTLLDPNRTGLIGFEYSDLTTTTGSLIAKRTTCNPAFAALMVRMLKEAGCQKGDLVILTLTGSFPALNIAALSACSVLELEARFISSIGASTYGANIPGFTWLEMEKYLYDIGVFPYHATAVAFGGVVETGGGIDGAGIALAQASADRHGAPFLTEGDYRDVVRSTLQRKAILDAKGKPACYINVGGGLTSLGWVAESARLDNGLLRAVPKSNDPARGLVFRYMEEGVPVIHLLNIERLANRYALPVDPIPLPEADPAAQTDIFSHRYLLRALILGASAMLALVLLSGESGEHKSGPGTSAARPERSIRWSYDLMHNKALSKFDAILRCFTPNEPRWTATELARHLDQPVTTLHGLLGDMVEMDFLVFSQTSKEYSVGFRSMELGALHANNFELSNIALGPMGHLVFNINYLVGLSVLYKGWMYVAATVLPLHSTIGLKYVGPRLPGHMSAGGMTILGHLPEDMVRHYCQLEWPGNSIPPPKYEELETELALVRERGYGLGRSFAKNELPETVGAPIFGKNNQILAAVVIIGDHEGFAPNEWDFLLGQLTNVANEISLRCGHLGQSHTYV
ncbi:MAG: poly-gamma-glutamate system protein [Desulfovibrionaceae bacterium]|nr:poly-gamma-glutamate system protein [Desulfovibrionaceae bacterium]